MRAVAERTANDAVETQVPVRIVDCDVHLTPTSPDIFIGYMSEPWRSQMIRRRLKGGEREAYSQYWNARRLDSIPSDGTPAGSDPQLVRRQLFRDADIDLAVVLPSVRMLVDPALNAASSAAYNRWMSETWLGDWNHDGRFFGSISVTVDDPAAAVREIHQWADHPYFKQLIIGHHSDRPIGQPQYEEIWKAAAEHNLPVAMHFTGHGAQALGFTPVGRFLRYVDYHSVAFPLTYSAHLVSLICSGVFDRYRDLRFVFVEGGFLWHRPMLNRLARHWDLLRTELDVRRDPLDYVRDHVRFTSQPIEESTEPREVARLMELFDADRVLMFSSDYPHFDFDDPKRAMPPGLDRTVRDRVMAGNAVELYDLPSSRPVVADDVARSGR